MQSRVRYACEWTTVGIGVAAQRCVKALTQSDVGLDLAWEPLTATTHGRTRASESADAAAWLRALRRPRLDGEVLVQHCVPGAWKEVAAELEPSYQIGHSVWELDDVPAMWIDQMSDVDEFWVPTEWNRAAFERAFDRPVHVVPHIAPDVVAAPPPMNLPDDVVVISTTSAWDWRKRPDRAIEAFCQAFTADDDVVLAMKTTPWHVCWPGGLTSVPELIHRITEQFPNPPTVYYDVSHWSAAQMMGLAQRSTATLSMTASEGWGLGTFDAATIGVPAIITGFGGHCEYLGADYPGLLPFRRVKTVHEQRDLFEVGTEWGHADMDAAVDLLRSVVDGTATALTERAATLAPELRATYGADVVGAQMVELLDAASDRVAGSSSTVAPDRNDADEVVILTPVKNAARHAAGFVDRVLALEHPRESLRVAILVSDSDDDSASVFRSEFERLAAAGVDAIVHERDFGFTIPDGLDRSAASIQLARRLVLARSRNHLLSRGLGDAAWALWIDVDVVDYPTDIISRLRAVDGDVVQPHCIGSNGSTFDLNAWTDRGRFHFDDYVGHELVELHAVGGTMLLVRADCHRDGLTWPAYRHGVVNERARIDPATIGRPEIGEVETEGLGILANDMGIACWGLPDVIIRHE